MPFFSRLACFLLFANLCYPALAEDLWPLVSGGRGVVMDEKYVQNVLKEFLSNRSAKTWTPDKRSIEKADAVLEEYLKKKLERSTAGTAEHMELSHILRNLHTSRRQYFGLMVKGKKSIWVNVFPKAEEGEEDPHKKWRHQLVEIVDGGSDFWRAEVEVESKDVTHFEVNDRR